MHVQVCVCACVCVKSFWMLSSNCIIPQLSSSLILFFFFLCYSHLHALSLWAEKQMNVTHVHQYHLAFSSLSSFSQSSCTPFVLGWVFYFLSDIPVFPLDHWLFSVIYHLNSTVGGNVMLQKNLSVKSCFLHLLEVRDSFCVIIQGF